MNWDPFQREVLAELGHVLYRSAGDESVADGVVAGVSAGAAASSPDSALRERLARAAGVPVSALPASWHDSEALARLRASGAAKRALWPRLRAMRTRPQ